MVRAAKGEKTQRQETGAWDLLPASVQRELKRSKARRPTGWIPKVFPHPVPPSIQKQVRELAKRDGVVAVVRGHAHESGQRTDEPAFIVLVKRKRTPRDEKELLPTVLVAGKRRFRVDVVEIRKLRHLAQISGSEGRGTVAAVGQSGSNYFALTAAHVVSPQDVDPTNSDLPSAEMNGVMGTVLWSRLGNSRPCDHAIVGFGNNAFPVGHPMANPLTTNQTELQPGSAVELWSEEQGGAWSQGMLFAYAVDTPIQVGNYIYENVALVQSANPGGALFAIPGDSGGMVFTPGQPPVAIGMVAGRSKPNSSNQSFSVVVPLSVLSDAWLAVFFPGG